MSGIFLIRDDGELVELSERPYASEDLLQELIAEYPSILAGDQITPDEPRRWLLVRREVPVPGDEEGAGRWSIDHVFLDNDGVPTLVEVKRSSDTRLRREVIGQMLDYAANSVAYIPAEKLRALYEARCDAAGEDPTDALRVAMARDDLDVDEYWRRVETNLQARRMRLIFVADQIPTELRRVVEYLNVEMANTDVLAVEIKQFVGADLRTLVPTLIGETAAAAARKGVRSEGREWDEASFFSDLEARRGAVETAVVRRLFAWASDQGLRLYFGKGATTGSFVPTYDGKRNSYWLATFWTNGQVEIAFQWLRLRPPFDEIEMRQNLLERLNAIPGVSLPADSLDRRPSFMLDALGTNPNAADDLIGVYEWMIGCALASGDAR